jgi:hypothetical protein
MLSYQRQFLVFRKVSRIRIDSKASPNDALPLLEQAKNALTEQPASILFVVDRSNSYDFLRKQIATVRNFKNDHWLVQSLWDGNTNCLAQSYREWSDHMRSKYAQWGLDGMPRWEQVSPNLD